MVKVPETLESLLDLMRAKGCASFEFEAQGIGGTPVKVRGSFGESANVAVPRHTFDQPGFPNISREDRAAYAAELARAHGFDDLARPISDIELALNPPVLDEAEEAADPTEALAPEAPRVSAPAGAPDPDASA